MALLFAESSGADPPGGLEGGGVSGPTGPAISIRGLNFSYDEGDRPKQVLFDLDLDIWPGEIALLTGPSGCGKTTLLTLIGGLRTVQPGNSLCLADNCTRVSPPTCRRFAGTSVSFSKCTTCSIS